MRIVAVLSRVPWPLEKGDKLRAYHLLKELSKHHDIYLFCLSDQPIHPLAESKLKEFCEVVYLHRLSKLGILYRLLRGIFSPLPFQVSYFNSKSALAAFDRFIERHVPHHVFCQLVRTAEFVRPYSVFDKSLDYMDALGEGMDKMAEKAVLTSWIRRIESKRLKRYEREVFPYFNHHFMISQQDIERMDIEDRHRIQLLVNGIDRSYFESVQVDAQGDLLFAGNMAYRPNIETAKYLVKEVMPIIWQKMPHATLTLAGANPTQEVRSLKSEKVRITGWVDDLRAVYQGHKVFLAPMFINTGLQNKLLEAMASRLPCITTYQANNALGAQPDNEILVADDAQTFAQLSIDMLGDPKAASILSSNAKAFVERNFSWEAGAEKFGKVAFGKFSEQRA